MADIACPVWSHGYVAEKGPTLPDRGAARAALGLPADGTVILASAGSGTIIRDLLDPIMEASILLAPRLPTGSSCSRAPTPPWTSAADSKSAA